MSKSQLGIFFQDRQHEVGSSCDEWHVYSPSYCLLYPNKLSFGLTPQNPNLNPSILFFHYYKTLTGIN